MTKTANDTASLACYYHLIGVQFYKTSDYLNAIEYNKKSLYLRNEYNDGLLWKTQRNLGLIYYQLNDFKTAEEYLIKSYTTSGAKSNRSLISILKNLAIVYTELGDFDKAIEYGELALDKNEDALGKADIYNILSRILNETDNPNSIEYAQKALEISYKLKNNDEIIESYMNLASAYTNMDNYAMALEYYQRTLDLSGNYQVELKANIVNNIGEINYSQKKYNIALEYFDKALTIYKNHLQNEFHYKYAEIYENIANQYFEFSELDSALLFYQKALINLTNNFRNLDIFQNPDPNDIQFYAYQNAALMRVLDLKAKAALKYYKQNNNLIYLELANNIYQTGFTFYELFLNDISSESSKFFHAAKKIPYIENALNVSYALQEMGESVNESVFQFMELSKASILLQSMKESKALKFSGLPDFLIELEKNLKFDISTYRRQLNDVINYEDSIGAKRIKDILFGKEIDYKDLIGNLEKNYPKYYNLKYSQNHITITDIKNLIDNKTALLEYFVGDSSIFILTIQKEQVNFQKIAKPVNFEQKINELTESIIYRYDLKYINQANEFYKLLAEKPIACLNDDIKHLRIISDAEMNEIPFAALLEDMPQTDSSYSIKFNDLNYLTNQFFISYAYSAKLLFNAHFESHIEASNNYIAFMAEDSAYINQYCEESVFNILSELNGKALIKNDCSISNFKDMANEYKIVNLTMHSTLGSLNFIDGELFESDIYNLDLTNNRLAVLTSCETNTGAIRKGEGVMSLSRAFIYAGSRSLVSTLWSVHSESTCVINELFFEQIKTGKAIDEALWIAQKDYIKNYTESSDRIDKNISAHPYYWSGIIPIGKMAPIELE